MKEIKKLLKGSEDVYLIATKTGCGISGTGAEILSCYTMMTKGLMEEFGEDAMREAFELATKNSDELAKIAVEKMKDFLKHMKEMFKGDDDLSTQ